MSTYTMMDGALRLYDSTPTPYYVALAFDQGDLSIAGEGQKRPEEVAIMHRGRGANSHYVSGTDEPIFEGIEVSFTIRVQNVVATHNKFLAALSNPRGGAWTVDGDTWVTTKGDFTLTDGAGSSFTDPAFADASKFCVNVEVLWTLGAVAIGRKIGAVYFPADQQSLAESEEGLILSCTGTAYGTITTITSFTAGTES